MPKANNVHRLNKSAPQPKKPRPIPENAVSVRIPQMCEMLGIGPTKAAELIRTNAVKSVLMGKTRLISVESIRALFDGRAA